MQMDDEVAHVGIIDSLLRLCLPRDIGAGVIREDADDVDLVEILEFAAAELGKLPAKNEMQQLFFWKFCGHGRSLVNAPRRRGYYRRSSLREFDFAIAHELE